MAAKEDLSSIQKNLPSREEQQEQATEHWLDALDRLVILPWAQDNHSAWTKAAQDSAVNDAVIDAGIAAAAEAERQAKAIASVSICGIDRTCRTMAYVSYNAAVELGSSNAYANAIHDHISDFANVIVYARRNGTTEKAVSFFIADAVVNAVVNAVAKIASLDFSGVVTPINSYRRKYINGICDYCKLFFNDRKNCPNAKKAAVYSKIVYERQAACKARRWRCGSNFSS